MNYARWGTLESHRLFWLVEPACLRLPTAGRLDLRFVPLSGRLTSTPKEIFFVSNVIDFLQDWRGAELFPSALAPSWRCVGMAPRQKGRRRGRGWDDLRRRRRLKTRMRTKTTSKDDDEDETLDDDDGTTDDEAEDAEDEEPKMKLTEGKQPDIALTYVRVA